MPTSTAKGENSSATGSKPNAAEHAVDHALERGLRAEDDHPGIDADQEIAGERQHHQQHHQVAEFPVAARDQQRHRVGHQRVVAYPLALLIARSPKRSRNLMMW